MASAMQPTRPTDSPAPADRRTRPLAVLGASAASLTVWAVARLLLGVHLMTRFSAGGAAQAVGPGIVAFVTVLAGLAAWGLLALLERFTHHARTIWGVIALTVLVASLAGPLSAGVTPAAKVVLACMHVAAAAVLVPALRPSLLGRGRSAMGRTGREPTLRPALPRLP